MHEKQRGAKLKKPRSLRVRLIFPLLASAALPLFLFAWIYQSRLIARLEDNLKSMILSGLKQSERSLDLKLEKYETLLYDFSTDDEVVRLLEDVDEGRDPFAVKSARLNRRLGDICNRFDGVEGMLLRTGGGGYIAYGRVDGSLPELADGDVQTYYPVRYAADTGDGPLYLFYIERRLTDSRDPAREVGSVVISVDEKVLRDAVKTDGNEIFCLEKDGILLSAPDREWIGKKLPAVAYAEDGGGVEILPDRSYASASLRNQATGWSLIEYYPLEDYNRTVREQVELFTAMVFSIFCLIVASVLYTTRPLITSVERILEMMGRVKKGDFKARMQEEPAMPEEIRDIGRGLNELTEQTGILMEQVRQSAIEQKNAEISALEAQIDPHFLYNTLDTINWKALSRGEYEISEMIGALADILRYAVKNAGGITTVEVELSWLKQYILLQQAKLGAEIKVFYNASADTRKLLLHKLLLQPLVENSIRHGLQNLKRDAILIITAGKEEGFLKLTVEDNGKGMSVDMVSLLNRKEYHRENHFGIENVRKRLVLYYGEGAGITFESVEGEYTRVSLMLPTIEEREDEDENRNCGG